MTESEDRFEVYRDRRGHWRWRRLATNGRIVGAASEGYVDKDAAEANMRRGPVGTDTWTIYQDRRGQWRWRRTAQNGKVVGAASEGYAARGDCEANAARHGRR
jgi:uncharacterized protein YegP (UPF0339 family)